MAGNERVVVHDEYDWIHAAIDAGAIDACTPYTGITDIDIGKLADSAFGDRALLIRLRSAHGDWRIVRNAVWLVAWHAAAEPEMIVGSGGFCFRPIDIRDVFPLQHRAENAVDSANSRREGSGRPKPLDI